MSIYTIYNAKKVQSDKNRELFSIQTILSTIIVIKSAAFTVAKRRIKDIFIASLHTRLLNL